MSSPTMRARLDRQMVALQLAESREKAQRLILAGVVRVNGQTAHKPSDSVTDTDQIEVEQAERFVSRGGEKLAAALRAYPVPVEGCVAADLGASTGGFTDCLLQHGAARVHAVDVGKGQLAWRLRQDARVIVHEGCNARHLAVDDLGERVQVLTIDVSFISLTKVLPAAADLMLTGGWLVALIKPQFEAGKKDVKKGGVVRDSQVHDRVVEEITRFATSSLGFQLMGVMESPLLGPAGNKEFLMTARKPNE